MAADEGIYLISNGLPPDQSRTERKAGKTRVAYALEVEPCRNSRWYERKVAKMGGNDQILFIPLALLEPFLKRRAPLIELVVIHNGHSVTGYRLYDRERHEHLKAELAKLSAVKRSRSKAKRRQLRKAKQRLKERIKRVR